MDEAGVFHSSSFMAPDAVAGIVKALALMLALVSSYRFLLRIAHTTNLVAHHLTMLAMLVCSLFAWLTFAYLFYRHNLETCIVRARLGVCACLRPLILTPRSVCVNRSTGRAGPAWFSTSCARVSGDATSSERRPHQLTLAQLSSTTSLSRKPTSQTSSCTR